MLLQFALVLAMIFQFFAVGISLKLTRVTKFNVSWILLSLGFIIMAVRCFIEFLPTISDVEPQTFREVFVWLGVAVSFFFAAGVFWIQKIFNYMKRVEDEKREMEKVFLSGIIQAEETERKRFAKDLHDGLGPILSTVKMSVSSITRTEKDDPTRKILRNADIAIDEAIKSIKEISNNLSPHILNNFGITKAIRNFINKINYSDTIRINFTSNFGTQRFDTNIEVVLYRVICELINNTIKHAKASTIDIVLHLKNNNIDCYYQDDGIGFNTEQLSVLNQNGMGYSNMLSRTTSLNGSFTINSEPGNGISVTFIIPVSSIKPEA